MPIKRILSSFVSCFLFVSAGSAQKSIPPAPPTIFRNLDGIVGYHQLMPVEFRVDDKVDAEKAFVVQPLLYPSYELLMSVRGGFCYAHISKWHVVAGVNKNKMSRKSSFRNLTAMLLYAQAIFDIYEIHARELDRLPTGDLPSGSGPTPDAAQRELEGQLQVFIEKKHDVIQSEVDALAKQVGQGRNLNKLPKMAAAIKKRLNDLPNPNDDGSPTKLVSPPPTTSNRPPAPQ